MNMDEIKVKDENKKGRNSLILFTVILLGGNILSSIILDKIDFFDVTFYLISLGVAIVGMAIFLRYFYLENKGKLLSKVEKNVMNTSCVIAVLMFFIPIFLLFIVIADKFFWPVIIFIGFLGALPSFLKGK